MRTVFRHSHATTTGARGGQTRTRACRASRSPGKERTATSWRGGEANALYNLRGAVGVLPSSLWINSRSDKQILEYARNLPPVQMVNVREQKPRRKSTTRHAGFVTGWWTASRILHARMLPRTGTGVCTRRKLSQRRIAPWRQARLYPFAQQAAVYSNGSAAARKDFRSRLYGPLKTGLQRRALPNYFGFARLYLCWQGNKRCLRAGFGARGTDLRPAKKYSGQDNTGIPW